MVGSQSTKTNKVIRSEALCNTELVYEKTVVCQMGNVQIAKFEDSFESTVYAHYIMAVAGRRFIW